PSGKRWARVCGWVMSAATAVTPGGRSRGVLDNPQTRAPWRVNSAASDVPTNPQPTMSVRLFARLVTQTAVIGESYGRAVGDDFRGGSGVFGRFRRTWRRLFVRGPQSKLQ